MAKRINKKADLNRGIMKAARKQSREEEIKLHGKQISRRNHVEENPKIYKRQRFDYRKHIDEAEDDIYGYDPWCSACSPDDAFFDSITDNAINREELEGMYGESLPDEELEHRIKNDDYVKNNIYENKKIHMKTNIKTLQKLINEAIKNTLEAQNNFSEDYSNISDEEIAKKFGLADNSINEDAYMPYKGVYSKKFNESVQNEIHTNEIINETVRDFLKKTYNKAKKGINDYVNEPEPVKKKVGSINNSENGNGNSFDDIIKESIHKVLKKDKKIKKMH